MRSCVTMRIFVGGLPRTATKDDVVRLFRQFGVSENAVVLPRDRRTRRRKGFAYVEIADTQRARAAIATFAGLEVGGKQLTVCMAEDRPLKRPRRALSIVLTMFAALQSTAAVQAGQLSSDIGVTLNPILGGIHESYNDLTHIAPVPIPLLELREQYGRFELDLGGLPPVASIQSFDVRQGHTSTQLSVLAGILRCWEARHHYSIGVGQTLYNQSTRYFDAIEIAGTGETQSSRVTGLNYQAGYQTALGSGRFEATVDYAPAMVGIQFTTYAVHRFRPRVDPESARQIDAAARYVRPAGRRADIIAGLRYVNYTASYAERNGGLSDRNCGLLLVLGYRIKLGR